VRLRETLRWFDTRPLFGLRVLVTRTREQASELARLLAERGAEPVELAALRIVPRYDEARLRGAIESLAEGAYRWLLFTSANAVDIFFQRLWAAGRDARSVRANVGAIGPGTAEALRRWGVAVDVMPERYVAEGLLEALDARGDVQGARVLVPRAEGAREALVEGLAARGASVEEVTLYVASPPEAPDVEGLRRLRDGEIDVATFASSSSVRNLAALLGGDVEPLRRCRIAAIGPVTAEAVVEVVGRSADAVANEYTIAGLVRAVERLVEGSEDS
jgi:uroporphyrinogen III methyltransferase/synthase